MKQLLITALLTLGYLSVNAQSKATYSDGVLTVNGVHYEFALVEAGTFTMGATTKTDYTNDNEFPAHEVTLTNNYYMGKTEVSQALWKAVMGTNPSHFKGDNLPVEQVSYYDCLVFIGNLNLLTGKEFRLPTEAEWEFAARGGNKSKNYQYSGTNSWEDLWTVPESKKTTHDVASKVPNELGIYNMSGNVSEWCNDYYGEYDSAPQTNPTGGSDVTACVYRGGSWDTFDAACRVTKRFSQAPSWASDYGLGLRIVLTADSAPAAEQTPSIANGDAGVSYSNGVLTANGVRYEMVKVEAGTFTMGATAEYGEEYEQDEKPAHKVTLTKDYYMGKTEVTQALWTAVMGNNPSLSKGDNKPVEQVSWNDCQTFISKLNAATGKNFRLPTEAEWEFAARGGNNSRHYKFSGSNNLDEVAWFGDNSNKTTHDVATKQPNELGIYDMSGNVEEWCQDGCRAYTSKAQCNPFTTRADSYRALRGGNRLNDPWVCRTSYRSSGNPESKSLFIGLRLVLSE